MARKDKIKKGVSGGVSPSNLPPLSYAERRRRRQEYNERAREINARRRERAQKVNAQRQAEAQAKWEEATRPPDLEANENLQRALTDNQDRYNQTISGIDEQDRSLQTAYGMGASGGDAASNPYSRAALLQRSYDQNQRASVNTMASRGQLYSGATQNAANTNASNYASAYDSLAKDFGARTQRLVDARVNAATAQTNANEAARRQAIAENAKLYATQLDAAPRFPKPEKFVPRLKKIRPAIPPRRPKRTGPSGGVRP